MHELALARALVELASARARAAGVQRVTRLHCRIGSLRQLEGGLLRAAFEAAREQTPCARADLLVEQCPLRAGCPSCGRVFAVEQWHWMCPDCGVEGESLDGGDELELVSIDVERPAP